MLSKLPVPKQNRKIVRVNSELIKRVQFFGSVGGTGTLRVTYQDGAVIDYEYVPYYIYQKVIQAESPGKYWLAVRGRYNWELQ